MNRQRGGEPGSPERHRGAQVEADRQWRNPVTANPRILSETTVVRFHQAGANGHDPLAFAVSRISRRSHGAGDIDTADEREFAQNAARPGRGERILVVDARVSAVNHDIARAKIVQIDGFETGLDVPADLGVNAKGLEGFHR